MSDILKRYSDFIEKNVYCLCNDFMNNLLNDNPDIYFEFENILIKKDDIDSAKEIFQYYIISEDAYKLLNILEEPVLKYYDLYIYGRPCFGQMIYLDFAYQTEKLERAFST